MVDIMQSGSPLPGDTITEERVSISASADMARYSLRGRDAAVLAAAIGRELPTGIGGCVNGIMQLGPDEFYALLPAGEALPLGEGQPVSVVDVSSRAVGIVVEGPGAAELIMSGCPLDLSKMAPGRATRTIYETTEIIVLRESETRFRIDVWRSFATWLWASLAGAAAE